MTNLFAPVDLHVDGLQLARDAAKHHRPQPQRLSDPRPLTVFADADEARRARVEFELQPDVERTLADLYEKQHELFRLEAELLDILASNPTEHERRKILGHEAKVTPSLPGVADTTVHVPGTLERCREKLADIELQIPRLKNAVERYVHARESLKPWPWHRINRERNVEVSRQAIVSGKSIQRRGA